MIGGLPEWCEVRRGGSKVLLVAPHGGRRPPIDPSAPPANLRVNDVYTPEVTSALAERLDAGCIINRGMDRNHTDLNRVSQVRSRAPWFLDVLAAEIALIAERHGEVEVVFLHGWNDGQLKCDIGIGAREVDGVLAAAEPTRLTVDRDYLEGRIAALRAACRRRGIDAPLGEKYPAIHPNNLVQLFGPERNGAGRINAVQLELTLPLRCPGEWREAFLDAAAEAFSEKPRINADPESRGSTRMDADRRESIFAAQAAANGVSSMHESLQFYDPDAGLGVFAGVGRMGPSRHGSRLLLFLGGSRIALYTGEIAPGSAAPLRFERHGSTVQLRFAGPILLIENGAAYLDLEAALAASHCVDARVSIDLDEGNRSGQGVAFGDVCGEVTIETRRFILATQGFSHVAALRSAGHAQTMLAAAFGAGHAFVGRIGAAQGPSSIVHFRAGTQQSLADVSLRVIEDGDVYTPSSFELRSPGVPPVRAQALNRMAILRAIPNGYVRVAFGVARFDWDGLAGFGLYEHALPVPAKN